MWSKGTTTTGVSSSPVASFAMNCECSLYSQFTANIDKWVSFFIRPDKCTPSSETSIEHLSEGIRIFLIVSDKCYLSWHTNLFWPFSRGLQIIFVTVGQMVSIPNKPLLNFHLTSSQSLSNLQYCKAKSKKNHQSYHAFCLLKISSVDYFSIFLRKINMIRLQWRMLIG